LQQSVLLLSLLPDMFFALVERSHAAKTVMETVLVAENPRFCTFLYNDEQYFANKC
jgi:hypothetical protein